MATVFRKNWLSYYIWFILYILDALYVDLLALLNCAVTSPSLVNKFRRISCYRQTVVCYNRWNPLSLLNSLFARYITIKGTPWSSLRTPKFSENFHARMSKVQISRHIAGQFLIQLQVFHMFRVRFSLGIS